MTIEKHDLDSIKIAVINALEEYSEKHLVTREMYYRDRGKIYTVLTVVGIMASIGVGSKFLPWLLRVVAL